MPHFPKPFYKKARGLWYVQIDSKQINLGVLHAIVLGVLHPI